MDMSVGMLDAAKHFWRTFSVISLKALFTWDALKISKLMFILTEV